MQFALELKKRVLRKDNLDTIAQLAYKTYLMWPDSKDVKFLNLLLHLNKMELGEGFLYTYTELENIANQLIENKEVVL